MKLYQLPYSHFSSKVRIVLLEKSINVEYPEIPGENPSSDEYHAISPTGLVPSLIDGRVKLSESEVIVEYLEEQYPDVRMLPIGADRRAQSRWLSRIHDLRIAPQLSVLFKNIFDDKADGTRIADDLETLYTELDLVESAITPTPYFFGNQFGLSDANYALSFWYATVLTEIQGDSFPIARFPRLSDWFSDAWLRPSVFEVLKDCKVALRRAELLPEAYCTENTQYFG